MLPVMVSFFKIDDGFAARAAKARETRIRIMQTIGNVANPKAAIVIVFLAIALFVTAFIQSQDRHVGALHAGSPELRKEAAIMKTAAPLPINSRLASTC